MATASLTAGVAQVEITPPPGTHLSGSVGEYRPAEDVLDPLFARVLILDDGARRLCIIALDLCILTRPFTMLLRRAAAERYGIAPEAVMVHATQTHTAPGVGDFMLDEDFPPVPFDWLRGSEAWYTTFVVAHVLDALAQAMAARQPVTLGAGSGIEGRYAHNRRAICRDGSVAMPWKGWQGGATGPTWIRYIEGPIDPEVGVVCLRGADGEPVAMLLHYTCHPVHVFPEKHISADWPGAWVDAVRAAHPTCLPLVLNGCCGNINPWPPFDPDYVEDHRRMGAALATMTDAVLAEMPCTADVTLDACVQTLALPFRAIPPEELAAAQRLLAAHPEPVWRDDTQTATTPEWFEAASIVSTELQRRREGTLDYEIQVFRIGELLLVGLPGEPFVEGQLHIKLHAPAAQTFVAHMVTQYVGYIPIAAAWERGGHEAHTRYWAKLAPEALETIQTAAVALADKVWAAREHEARAACP